MGKNTAAGVNAAIKQMAQLLGAVLGIILGTVLMCAPAYSQGSNGRILGTVTDQTGGVIAGATVTVADTQRGTSRVLTTDEAGEYSAPNLLPGTYKVRAESKGFSATERTDLLLETGKDIRVDFSLTPGAQTQTITVTEALPVVETTNATLGGTLSNQTINDLPLNGRNYQNLLSLRPGVLAEPGGGSWTQSTNGVRPEDNVFLVNGMLNVGAFSALSILNAPALAGDAASILPIDAIQEFNIEENPRAEYGWKPGAVINVGIKSGTNSLHGTAYAFGRTTAFDARNFYDRPSENCTAPCPKTEVGLEQYGGTVGGPIKKDKIFFFAGYEGQRYTVGSPFLANVPITGSLAATPGGANPAQSVPDAEAALNKRCATPAMFSTFYCTGSSSVGSTANLSALSLHLLQNFFPANNTTSITVPANFPSNFGSDNWVAKFDLHLNEKNTLNAMYFIANSTVNDEDSAYLQPIFLTVQTQRPQVGNVDWTYTPNSRLVNEAEFGVQYLFKPSFVGDHTVNPTTYGLNTGVTNPLFFGMPQISITGGGTTFTTLGGATWPKIQGPETDFVFQDHVSYLAGKHSFKFGGEIIDDNFTGGALNGVRGAIRFGNNTAFTGASSLEDYLLGLPNRGTQLVGNALRRAHNADYAAFVQDDWRIKPRVILNLGVRYEVDGVIKEVNDQFGNFLPSQGLVQVGHGITDPYNGDHNNFAPRLGLAWDIFGTGKTVLRAGGSMIYEQLSYNVFLAYSNTLGLGTVPTGAIVGGTTAAPVTAGGNIQVGSFTFPACGTGTCASSVVNWNGSSVGGATIFPTGAVNCSPAVTVAGVKGTPCSTVAVNPNLRTPYVSTWTFEIQHAFTNNLSLEVGYVGDHGTKLIGFADINQPVPSLVSPATPTCTTCEQAARPYNTAFPYLASIFQLSNQDLSNYNSLQATLTERTSHGLSFTAGYTYSHALDDASGNFGGGLPQDSTRPGLEYGSSNFDIRNRFTLSTTYAFPDHKGLAQLLQGWKVNSIVMVQTAQPWTASDGSGDFSLTGDGGRWDFFGNPQDFTSGPNFTQIPFLAGPAAAADPTCAADAASVGATVQLATTGCYKQNGSVLLAPANGQFGTAGRNIFRGSGFKNWDLSVTKEFSFRETIKAQFRAEVFNILNHANFATPGVNGGGSSSPTGSNFGCACATPDTAASNPVLGSGGSRSMQLGLKLIF